MTNSGCAKGIIGLKQRKNRDDPYMKSNRVLRPRVSSVCIGSNIADTLGSNHDSVGSNAKVSKRIQ